MASSEAHSRPTAKSSAVLAVMLLALLALPACAPVAFWRKPVVPITVQLNFTHQAQFAGFYAAQQQGYYAAEGLSVTLVERPATVDPIVVVASGEAQFGVAAADTLLTMRAQGLPVRAIAAIYRRSPRVYIALADSGIVRPQDLAGKTIAVGVNGRPMLASLLQGAGLRLDEVMLVPWSADIKGFYAREYDARPAFITNEVLAALQAGYRLNIIYPDDYGIHFYGDTLFVGDDFAASNPDATQRFLRATLKGWAFAVANPKSVGTLVREYAPAVDVAFENAKMSASLPLIDTGEDRIGWMKPEIWAGMEATLREQGVLTRTLDVTQVYTMQFLQAIYGK